MLTSVRDCVVGRPVTTPVPNRLRGMTQTPHTSTTATPHHGAHAPQPPTPTLGEMLEDTINLIVGLGIALLPLLLLAVPGIILFVVLPAILLLALAVPLAVIGAVIAVPPYLLARWLRRRRRTAARPAGLRQRAAV